MATGIEQLKAELGERYSPKTIREYLRQASNFFKVAGDKPSYERHEFLAYFDKLIKEGKGQATLNMAWFTVKAICRSKNISKFPCRGGFKGDQPRVRKIEVREISIDGESCEVSGPTPEYQEIADLIAWVKENGNPRQKAYLALSTIYAMRAIEISTINKKEDIKGDRIFCRTAKRGQPKWHRIPPEVLEFIKGYKYPDLEEQAVWSTFKQMRKQAGLAKTNTLTPHGIRRWLNTYFRHLPGFNLATWYAFARWRQNTGDMTEVYDHPSSERVDQDTFASHPLLPLWGNGTQDKARIRKVVIAGGRTIGELDDNNQFIPFVG